MDNNLRHSCREYEVFHMDTYESIFVVHAHNVLHMKILPGLLLAIGHSRNPSCVKCQALCIRTGIVFMVCTNTFCRASAQLSSQANCLA